MLSTKMLLSDLLIEDLICLLTMQKLYELWNYFRFFDDSRPQSRPLPLAGGALAGEKQDKIPENITG